jgi:hypothetical protein
MTKPRNFLIILFLFWGVNTAPQVFAADPLPNPLSLEQALTYAEDHPRSDLDVTANQRYPLFKPYYMNCHSLAYANEAYANRTGLDKERWQLFSPLFSSKESVQLDILQRFFDVLLADTNFAFNNENMAGAYITYDRTVNRQELNAASELLVAEKESEYNRIRQQRFASENTQRLTRSLLAQAVNSPEKLPADLVPIENLPAIPAELPSLNELYAITLKENNGLKKRLDDLSNKEKAVVEMMLRQYLLEQLLLIQQLNVAQTNAETETYWRDLKLDQSRTLYDMEVKSDLGDSMAQQTRAHLQEKQISYCKTLAWGALNLLQGRELLYSEPLEVKEQQESPAEKQEE